MLLFFFTALCNVGVDGDCALSHVKEKFKASFRQRHFRIVQNLLCSFNFQSYYSRKQK